MTDQALFPLILAHVKANPGAVTPRIRLAVGFESSDKNRFLRVMERCAGLNPQLVMRKGRWYIEKKRNPAMPRAYDWKPLQAQRQTIVLRGDYLRNFI